MRPVECMHHRGARRFFWRMARVTVLSCPPCKSLMGRLRCALQQRGHVPQAGYAQATDSCCTGTLAYLCCHVQAQHARPQCAWHGKVSALPSSACRALEGIRHCWMRAQAAAGEQATWWAGGSTSAPCTTHPLSWLMAAVWRLLLQCRPHRSDRRALPMQTLLCKALYTAQ